ncbi:MAG: class I SAM-dependent methyltransferase [Alphaproteobacteria bacterium]
MHTSFEQLSHFYDSDIGNIARDVVCDNIKAFWPDLHGLRIMGAGYAMPYFDEVISDDVERVFCVTSLRGRVSGWPHNGKGIVAQAKDNRLPFEHSSIDRALLVHHIENCNDMRKALREIWRVLKPNGRVLLVVPNRMGMWARADWTPWGHGRPFSHMQITNFLKDNLLCVEETRGALFVPPLPDSPVMMKSARLIERFGKNVLPFVAGVHIIEASKQVYARVDGNGSGSGVLSKTKGLLGTKPQAVPQNFTSQMLSQEDFPDQFRP